MRTLKDLLADPFRTAEALLEARALLERCVADDGLFNLGHTVGVGYDAADVEAATLKAATLRAEVRAFLDK